MPFKPLALAALVALPMNARAADTQLTIYSGDFDSIAQAYPGQGIGGFALVREAHRIRLASGANEIPISGLPAAIDASGVRFAPDDDKLRVTGQSFHFALAEQSELLRRALGEVVTVTQAVGNERQTHRGRLLAAGNGLTLALDDGRVLALADYASFELAMLPGGVHARPTLAFEVQSPRAGEAGFVLDYPTAGLAWRAEYVATLATGGDCRMDFSGSAQVLNRSGATFEGAQVTLVAGEPNRQRAPQPQMLMMAKGARMDAAEAAPTPESSGEYHAYRLPGAITLADGSVQRVPLLADAGGVRCARRYESRSPLGAYRPSSPIVHPEFGPDGEQPVLALLEFANRQDAGLGVPLPAGRLRVFERGRDGADAFLGEAMLAHTASGREVRAALGQAFDLSLKRTREAFDLASDRREMSERIALLARNAKPSSATVRVLEVLPRWSDWDIVESSLPWTRVDAQTIAFEVPVPAAGEATVRYAVRYRWPESVKP